MSSAEVGLRTDKTEENKYGWVLVDQVPANEPCVVYLGGDSATEDRVANGYAKEIEQELEMTVDCHMPVYSVKYRFGDNLYEWSRRYEFVKHRQDLDEDSVKRVNRYVTDEDKNPRYIDELYQKLVAPRISQNCGTERLSTAEACRRVRMMTFVAHCHGAYVAQKLEDKMQDEMKRLGYSLEERKAVQSQMVVLAHAPAGPLGVSKSQIIGFKSVYDRETPVPGNHFYDYIEERRQEEKKRFLAEKFHDEQDIKDNRWFDFKPCYFAGKQGNFFMIKQKFEWIKDEGPCQRNKSEHGNISFAVSERHTYDGKVMAMFGKSIFYNAIHNSLQQVNGFKPLPPIEELILPPIEQMKARYGEVFRQFAENGKKFRTEVYNYARSKLSLRRSTTNAGAER
ncbi:MAG: hypothetical protein J6Y91_00255 [Alphaproteobacteria bacterium]|nr:hypothetical protein [Alphaproteobacteria bacterium]